jgi:t-SNARE complex subunit (syntaxin)
MQIENGKKYKERIVRQFRIGVCVNISLCEIIMFYLLLLNLVKPDVTQHEIDQLLGEESGQIFTSQVVL